MQTDLILASASPRRHELLAGLGYEFQVVPANIDESPFPAELPLTHVERLAREKALTVVRTHPAQTVLAADTIVVVDGEILGKPIDDQHACAMLRSLSGRRHEVMTALAVASGDALESTVQRSIVQFRPIRPAEIAAYVATGEPFDKAGSYGIQGGAARFVESLHGSYTGIMGLPLCQTEQLLRRFGCVPDDFAL